jgi:hypothetical protein
METSLPKVDTDWFPLKDVTISLFPNLPRCNDEDLHEKIIVKFLFGQLKHLEEGGTKVPLYTNQLPTFCSKGTCEEEMHG